MLANLPPVSTTLGKMVENFATGVVDKGGAPWLANISANVKKIWNGPNGLLWGSGETNSWKKARSKKSCYTVPLNWTNEIWFGEFCCFSWAAVTSWPACGLSGLFLPGSTMTRSPISEDYHLCWVCTAVWKNNKIARKNRKKEDKKWRYFMFWSAKCSLLRAARFRLVFDVQFGG